MSEFQPTSEQWQAPVRQLFNEALFTPGAEPGWWSYNGMSPEHEFCQFAGMLAKLLRPALIVETGVGQGYVTRAVLEVLGEGQTLWCYESDNAWRAALARLDEMRGPLCRPPTPPDDVLAEAGLVLLDSDAPVRLGEIERWASLAPDGAVALIHDTGEQHDESTHHSMIRELITDLRIPGVFLHNPRGSFLAMNICANGVEIPDTDPDVEEA